MSAIKTLAFLDLETTGLPDLEFFKTKITELSIIACPVDHFLSDVRYPRVLHKLTLCFNPYKRIDLKSTEVTGLSNELLEFENKFDKNALKTIEYFLNQLQQPVVLIAHNGNNFDFPLLKKHYDKLEGSFPFIVKCCDSLPVFRKIDEILEERKKLLSQSYSLQRWTQVNGNGYDSALLNIDEVPLNTSVDKSKEEIDKEFFNIIKSELEEMNEAETEADCKSRSNYDDVKSKQEANETTPRVLTKPQNLQPHSKISITTRSSTFKRQLFPSSSFSAIANKTRKSFSLREIYKRINNSYPEVSHAAESDVVTLIKCSLHHREDFVKIVNETCMDFDDIKKF